MPGVQSLAVLPVFILIAPPFTAPSQMTGCHKCFFCCQKWTSGLWTGISRVFRSKRGRLIVSAGAAGAAADCRTGPLWVQAPLSSKQLCLAAGRPAQIVMFGCANHILPHQRDYAGLQLSTFTSWAAASSWTGSAARETAQGSAACRTPRHIQIYPFPCRDDSPNPVQKMPQSSPPPPPPASRSSYGFTRTPFAHVRGPTARPPSVVAVQRQQNPPAAFNQPLLVALAAGNMWAGGAGYALIDPWKWREKDFDGGGRQNRC